jgi:hypothetical protein
MEVPPQRHLPGGPAGLRLRGYGARLAELWCLPAFDKAPPRGLEGLVCVSLL